MDETTVEKRSRRMEVVTDPADRLFDLLSTFSVLRSNGQALIGQIRGSLNEMRELRTRLRRQQRRSPSRFETAKAMGRPT